MVVWAERRDSTRVRSAGSPSDSDFDKAEVLADYRLGHESRHASLVGRKEVLTGKAKFGIFGDGKEVAQIAMAKAFRDGDFRTGYYRDQTFMLATGTLTLEQFFAQLYADPDVAHDPHSAGRQMNAHFATRSLHPDGTWRNLMEIKNSAADSSPTASQMARSVGLALASKLYRENPDLHALSQFSDGGNEVCFCTIGDASCAEGIFWEAVNAAAVMQVPLAISIWDDGYGISVPKKFQIAKESLAEVLRGFAASKKGEGVDLYSVKGWDYPALCEIYGRAVAGTRKTHRPSLIVVEELTQPQGHSTSGSHERYKPKERLQWEADFDCLRKMREWILKRGFATPEQLDTIEKEAKERVQEARRRASEDHLGPIRSEMRDLCELLDRIARSSRNRDRLVGVKRGLESSVHLLRRDVMRAAKTALRLLHDEDHPEKEKLLRWKDAYERENEGRYNSHLYSQSAESALQVPEVKPVYSAESPTLLGFEVLNRCFDAAFRREPRLVAFGEDVGRLGDVNQGFAGLQSKHGERRIFDTGIREATIIGQGIGLAMRGLRPIAEIQYLDYLVYGLQPLTDDVSTLQYRTRGGQKAPVIVRTRGHRLEGIWHTGSPMGMILHSLRGMHVCVPRDMTRAAGMYNTLLRSDDPALVVECLNGYRLKERLPDNIGEFTVPLGVPDVLREGRDVTIVTYGSCVRIAQAAAEALEPLGISCELIDVQTLLPFDRPHTLLASLRKTSRIVFMDEDVPGGATAYMMREVLEAQGGYDWLDSPPRTLPAKPHRGAYGSDGDYFSKPNMEDLVQAVAELLHESNPRRFPRWW